MRILHFSDLHISDVAFGLGFVDVASRLWSHKKADFERLAELWDAPALRLQFLSSHDELRLRAAAYLAYTLSPRPDLIVVTGDLTMQGRFRSLRPAYRALFGERASRFRNHLDLYRAIHQREVSSARPCFGGAGCPVIVLPGNHDRFSSRFLAPGGIQFDRLFRRPWPFGQGAGLLWPPGGTAGWGGNCSVVGADFSLLAKDSAGRPLNGRFGKGRARLPVIDQMRSLSASVREACPASSLIWAVHFAPLASRGTLELLEESRLLDAARDENVSLVLCGHTHESGFFFYDSTAFSMCGSTASGGEAHHWAHVVTIEGDNPDAPQIGCERHYYIREESNFILEDDARRRGFRVPNAVFPNGTTERPTRPAGDSTMGIAANGLNRAGNSGRELTRL